MTDDPLIVAAPECYARKFSDPGKQCPRPATWRSIGTGGDTDGWTWCNEHAAVLGAEFKERIDDA